MTDMQVTLADAIGNVEVLDEIAVADGQPSIEGVSLPLHYDVSFDVCFEDKSAFVTANARYIEEACRHAELNELLDEGHEHAVNLYTWRCCSRAVPMPTSNDQPNRMEIYTKVVEVMAPEVHKLAQFMFFQEKAIARFCEEVRRLSHAEKRREFISEAYLLSLGKMLNMFAVLDELKNMKASIKNDYSMFRRATQLLKTMGDVQQSHDLSMFLATQNKIRDNLRDILTRIEGYEELLVDIVNICIFLTDNKMYLTPHDKHLLVKVMAFSVYLLDSGEVPNLVRLDHKKRVSIAKMDGIFHRQTTVPLFGDMQISPFVLVRRATHYDASRWPLSHEEGIGCPVELTDRLGKARVDHQEYVTHMARLHNKLAVCETEGNAHDDDEVAELALRGVQLLCAWTGDVVETISWKLQHPCDARNCPAEAEDYEKATRYNYSNEEKAALIEHMSMVKGLQAMLVKFDTHFTEAIRRHVYTEMHKFVHVTLKEPLRKATKNKKDVIRAVIQSVIDTCGDGEGGAKRAIGPSTTQLYIARTMIESLLAAAHRKRKEMEPSTLISLENFLRMSFFWPQLLALTATLRKCADLSQLWFREFYLEMTMGTRIQFPIEMSLPWIFAEHILTSKDPALTECILYQLDLYNDAADCALTVFRKRHLYDEVEAEVNLCFDQFVFQLSEHVYAHYKQLASSMLLDKRFGSECQRNGINITMPGNMRYSTLLRQRHVHLLGRSIDLNRLVTQRINTAILKSLDVALARFEAADLTHIVELHALIDANRLCHALLQRELKGLSPFDDLLAEANHNVSAPYGRITLHVFFEINYDFLPNFVFNGSTGRFVRGKGRSSKVARDRPPVAQLAHEWGSKSINAAYSNIYSMYNQFIGSPHFKCIVQLIGYEGIAVTLQEMMGIARGLLQGSLLQYTQQLMGRLPKTCKLPRYDYGSPGVVTFYLAQLQEVAAAGEVRQEMMQHMRELGNCILLCMLLEQSMSEEEVTDLMHAAPFQNVIPRPYAKEKEDINHKIEMLQQKYSRLHVVQVIDRLGTQHQSEVVRDGDLLTKERLCCGLTIFKVFLDRVADALEDNAAVWRGGVAFLAIDECNEWHRLWSAMQFHYCIPSKDTANNVEVLYGEGVHWAACAIMVLLGQHRRFDVLDFSYHLMRMQRVDGKTDEVRGVGGVKEMCDRVRRFQMLNNQIMDCLLKHVTPLDGQEGEAAFENMGEAREVVYETDDLPESDQTPGLDEERFDSAEIDGRGNDVEGAFRVFKGADYLSRRRQQAYAHGPYSLEVLALPDRHLETPKQRFDRLVLECNELEQSVATFKEGGSVDACHVTADELVALQTQLKSLQTEQLTSQNSHVNMADPHGALLAKMGEQMASKTRSSDASAKGGPTGVVYEMFAHEGSTVDVARQEARLSKLEKLLGTSDGLTASIGETLAGLAERVRLLDAPTVDGIDDKLRSVVKQINDIATLQDGEAQGTDKINELHAMMCKWEEVRSSLPSVCQRLVALQQLHEQSMHTSQAVTQMEGGSQQLGQSLATGRQLLDEVRTMVTLNQKQMNDNVADLDKRIKALK